LLQPEFYLNEAIQLPLAYGKSGYPALTVAASVMNISYSFLNLLIPVVFGK